MQFKYKIQNRPIAIFDSGTGGLSVLKHIQTIMPSENLVYLGDTANMPYGEHSQEEIIKFTYKNIGFLKTFNPKIIVAACGTITSCLEYVEIKKDNIVGIIEPSCVAATNTTENGKIGIMCTRATAKSEAYEKCIINLNKSLKVITVACPELAPLVEQINFSRSQSKLKNVVEIYTLNLIECNVDTIILGCTHYPIVKDIIQQSVGNNVKLIDSGYETAKYVQKYLQGKNLQNSQKSTGQCSFYATEDIQSFSLAAKSFLGYDISNNLKLINI